MHLISLTANKSSFRSVYFKNEVGVNIIAAKQSSETKKSDQHFKTSNGVGKSLLVSLIHFCLGSSRKKEFDKKIPDWEFYLTFKLGNKEFRASRKTKYKDQLYIDLNGKKMKLNEYTYFLAKQVFLIPDNVSSLSFRSLIPFFIRPNKKAYNDVLRPNTQGTDYQFLLYNSFLLDLNIELVQQKHINKKELDKVTSLIKELKENPRIQRFNSKSTDLSLADIEEQLTHLKKNLKSFKIAKDYEDIKNDADALQQEVDAILNKITILKLQISNIDQSLEIDPDIDLKSIQSIYKEAKIYFNDTLTKRLDELNVFYKKITTSRKNRLLEQKNSTILKLEKHKKLLEDKQNILDKNLEYLDTHQALDLYVSISSKIADLEADRNNILSFKNLIDEYKSNKARIDEAQAKNNQLAISYIQEIEKHRNTIRDNFRSFAKRFYPKHSSGIIIENNDQNNQTRYNISVRIEGDKSDGINSVKIFCYDFLLMLLGCNHKIDFLFHDSRLLDSIDPRQKCELFKIVNEYCIAFNKQYIITANENQLTDCKSSLRDTDEYNDLIRNNIIFELGDSSDSEKLLGIQVDLNYK